MNRCLGIIITGLVMLVMLGCGIKGALTLPSPARPDYAVPVEHLTDITGEPEISAAIDLDRNP